MKEVYEFRVPVESASFLPDDVGERDESVVIVRCARGDQCWNRIQHEHNRTRDSGRSPAFLGWEIRREYSDVELMQAELFVVSFTTTFEPCGEECGTQYDEAAACSHEFEAAQEVDVSGHSVRMGPYTCGAGFKQVSPLKLRKSSIPRSVDFARTIADEIVVSERAVDAFLQAGLTGAIFSPIEAGSRSRRTDPITHQQLGIKSPRVSMLPETRAGEDPFDDASYGRCPNGHLLGLNRLTEIQVDRVTLPNVDILATQQLFGCRVGLLRPAPEVLFSPRARAVVLESGLKGLRFEVARLL